MTTRAKLPDWEGDGEAFVDAFMLWLTEAGKTRYEAEVTQLEHALQTAAHAVDDGAGDEAIVSALLHAAIWCWASTGDGPTSCAATRGTRRWGPAGWRASCRPP